MDLNLLVQLVEFEIYKTHQLLVVTLPETNIAMENPPFWWYLPGKMGFSWAMSVSGRVDSYFFQKDLGELYYWTNNVNKKYVKNPSTLLFDQNFFILQIMSRNYRSFGGGGFTDGRSRVTIVLNQTIVSWAVFKTGWFIGVLVMVCYTPPKIDMDTKKKQEFPLLKPC